MTARTAGRLAWSLWGLAMALEVAGILLWLPNHAELVDRFGTSEDIYPHVFLVPGYATVGAVTAARRRNRVGWLFLAFALPLHPRCPGERWRRWPPSRSRCCWTPPNAPPAHGLAPGRC